MSIVRSIKDGESPAPFFAQFFQKEDGEVVEFKYRLKRIEGAKAIYEYIVPADKAADRKARK